MKHLSVESFTSPLIEAIDPEEILDNAIALESLYSEVNFIASEIDKALDVNLALENLSNLVSRLKTISPEQNTLIQIAGDLAVAGSNINPEYVVPSLESSELVVGESGGGEEIASKLKGRIQSIIKAILAFIKKLWNTIKDALTRALLSSQQGHAQIESLNDRVKKIKDWSVGKDKKISIKPVVMAKPGDEAGVKIIENIKLIHEAKAYISNIKDSRIEALKFSDNIQKQATIILAVLSKTGYGESSDIDGLLSLLNTLTPEKSHYFLGGLTIHEGLERGVDIGKNDDGSVSGRGLDVLSDTYRHLRTRSVQAETTDVEDIDVLTKPELNYTIEILRELINQTYDSHGGLNGVIKELMDRTERNSLIVTAKLHEFTENKNFIIELTSTNALRRSIFARKVVPEYLTWTANYSTVYHVALLRNTLNLIKRLIPLVQTSLRVYGV